MFRKSTVLALLLLFILLLGAVGELAAQNPQPNAWPRADLKVRNGPGQKFSDIGTIPASTPLILEARNRDTSWVVVHTVDNATRGWVKTSFLQIARGVSVYRLPVSPDNIGVQGAPPPPPAMPTVVLNKNLTASVLPQITGKVRATIRNIRVLGRQLGTNPRVFSKVGDCMTDHWAFLDVFGFKTYDLGQYGYLQGVINHFSVPPRDGIQDSFVVKSQASLNGFNSAAVMDPTFADPKFCTPGESPLECEYRLNKPGIAIIMFGTADVLVMTPQQFNFYMRGLIKRTMDRGVIPLLSTFPENLSVRDKSKQINQVILTIAAEKGLPVMNLQKALESLPNNGIDGDLIHLTIPPDGRSGFFTDQNLALFGYNVRNLVTLQALDVVRQAIPF
jgi:uncharacterized protein YraI